MTRRIKVKGHEIKDADISHISLVKRGANRIPFAIIKNEDSHLDLDFVKSEAAKRGMIAKKMDRLIGDERVEQIALFKSDKFVGWAARKGQIDTRDLASDRVKKSGNYVAPETPGEVAADDPIHATRRLEVAMRRTLEVERDGKIAAANQLAAEGRYSPANDAAIKALERDIKVLDAQLAALGGGDVTKAESSLDLLGRGIATAFVARGGQSFKIDAGATPETLTKADKKFAEDLRREVLGVRDQSAAIEKAERDELLSNPLGLRSMRKPR